MPANDFGKVIPVRVALRCRPLISKEVLEGCQKCLQFVDGEPQIILGTNKNFTYDYVFSPDTAQDEVYDKAVKSLVTGIFKGYNATVLAYGQTGSGKTFTMGGGYGVSMDTRDDVLGVIPRVIKELFAEIDSLDNQEVTVRVSYLEIYKEDLLDLLVPVEGRDKDAVAIREDTEGIRITGLTEKRVLTVEDTIGCLESGSHGRTTGSTAMNTESSRSHAIFTIHVDRANKADEQDFCKAKFHLVDLAGSERQKKTRAEGERFKEGVNINKGLLALGNVISALGDEVQRNKHVPYRDSKLTRLLQDSLGGNSHTVMIACVSPADSNMEETLSTLRYADRARKIKNKPVVNRDPKAAEILRLRQIVQDLQMQLYDTGKPMQDIIKSAPLMIESSSSAKSTSVGDLAKLKEMEEKIKKLEAERDDLHEQLNQAVDANLEQAEKVIKLELMQEQYLHKISQLKEVGLQVSALNATVAAAGEGVGAGDAEDSMMADKTKTMLHELTQKLHEIEMEPSPELLNMSQETDDAETSTTGDNADHTVSEELKKEHDQRRAKLTQDLNNLNKLLSQKEDLVMKLKSDKNMAEIQAEYEIEKKQLEGKLDSLMSEKGDLEMQLRMAKTSEAKSKISEQRRLRVKEVEQELSQLRKKITEQNKMIKIKEQSDKQLLKYAADIQQMKTNRVKLIKQIKEDNEQFRKFRQQKDREVMQLKAKERKRQADMVKLERKVVTQQAMARRKAEEAAAAQKRLKEALMKQKQVAEDRAKRQETSDGSAFATRLKRWLQEELGMAVAVEEARQHLEQLKTNRTELAEELLKEKAVLDDSQPGLKKRKSKNGRSIDVSQLRLESEQKVKDIETEMELISVQIHGLNEKLAESTDNTARTQGVMAQIHSLAEGRTAVRILMTKLINSSLRKSNAMKEVDELKRDMGELEKMALSNEEELKQEREQASQSLFETRREYEHKVLYLMSRLNEKDENLNNHPEIDEKTKHRLKFQNEEIKRLYSLQEDLEVKTVECEKLRRELTSLNYKQRLMKPGERELGEFSFFSPALASKGIPLVEPSQPTRSRASKIPLSWEDTEEEEEDREAEEEVVKLEDDEWVQGATPGYGKNWPHLIRKTSRSQRYANSPDSTPMSSLSSSAATTEQSVSMDTTSDTPPQAPSTASSSSCGCKTSCSSRRCQCSRGGDKCGELCKCDANKCVNREQPEPDSTQDSNASQATELNTLNTTFDVSDRKSDTTVLASSLSSNAVPKSKAAATTKSKTGVTRKSQEIQDENDEELLKKSGIMKKKRRLQAAPSSFFPDVN